MMRFVLILFLACGPALGAGGKCPNGDGGNCPGPAGCVTTSHVCFQRKASTMYRVLDDWLKKPAFRRDFTRAQLRALEKVRTEMGEIVRLTAELNRQLGRGDANLSNAILSEAKDLYEFLEALLRHPRYRGRFTAEERRTIAAYRAVIGGHLGNPRDKQALAGVLLQSRTGRFPGGYKALGQLITAQRYSEFAAGAAGSPDARRHNAGKPFDEQNIPSDVSHLLKNGRETVGSDVVDLRDVTPSPEKRKWMEYYEAQRQKERAEVLKAMKERPEKVIRVEPPAPGKSPTTPRPTPEDRRKAEDLVREQAKKAEKKPPSNGFENLIDELTQDGTKEGETGGHK